MWQMLSIRSQDLRTGGYLNGQRSVTLVVSRQPGANIIDTVETRQRT